MRFYAFAIGGLLLSQRLTATTFITMTEEEKIKVASAICAVEVVSTQTETFASSVRTRAHVRKLHANSQTIDCFKGNPDDEFDIVWPGGILKSVDSKGKAVSQITRIPGTPNLKVGQNLLLYLWKKEAGDLYTILSWENGINPLQWDQKLKDYKLKYPLISGQAKNATKSHTKSAAMKTPPPTLTEFKKKVSDTLNKK